MEHASCYTPQCTRREHCTLWHNALKEVEHGNSLVTITNPSSSTRLADTTTAPTTTSTS